MFTAYWTDFYKQKSEETKSIQVYDRLAAWIAENNIVIEDYKSTIAKVEALQAWRAEMIKYICAFVAFVAQQDETFKGLAANYATYKRSLEHARKLVQATRALPFPLPKIDEAIAEFFTEPGKHSKSKTEKNPISEQVQDGSEDVTMEDEETVDDTVVDIVEETVEETVEDAVEETVEDAVEEQSPEQFQAMCLLAKDCLLTGKACSIVVKENYCMVKFL
ncbi:hypothetical protein GGF32_006255 [Allomyces javanicus]|nr:hypothetical protein GGF32_006255 [Allomyces javanicus]